MPYYSDDIIEEVRSRNDIVDVISQYVRLSKRAVPILDSARSIMKKQAPFPCRRTSRCITASDAARVEMYLRF